jgi:hypothetical protein
MIEDASQRHRKRYLSFMLGVRPLSGEWLLRVEMAVWKRRFRH